jgi:ABC-type multidrug transport system ATPase subunit
MTLGHPDALQPGVSSREANARKSADFEQLRAEALARMNTQPSQKRKRTALLTEGDPEKGQQLREVDVFKAGRDTRKKIVEQALNTEYQDQEEMLRKIKERMDRVGIQLSTVEVRFQNLSIAAEVYVGDRALPTVSNSYRNFFEKYLIWLRLMKADKRKFVILDNISGIIPPGRMTLLLGPPGAGKTTLLTALAGKLQHGTNLKVRGDITYNGHTFKDFWAQRTAAYVNQVDNHLAELTVRETFDFASRCQGVGHKAEELAELERLEREQGIMPDPAIDAFMKSETREGKRESLVTDYIIKILGLEVCADTPVGNAMIRGISGGQKKRVTTGEMIVGPKKTLFLDEISTGLDSSSTYQIMKCLRDFTHFRQATVVIALLQPPPETYDLFDDILLLSEGHIVYHGPREEVLGFFASMGFRCPERKGVPDFLQEVTSKKDQQQYWSRKDPWHFVPVMAFADAFLSYQTGQRNQDALATPFPKEQSGKTALVTRKRALTGAQAFKALMRRELTLVQRNAFVYVFKAVQASIVAIITGTVYLRTQLHPISYPDAQRYAGMLFFSQLMMFFNGIAEMTFTIDRLPTFFKQRDDMFFPTWSFVLPTTVVRIPVSALETGLWAVLTYWTVGLTPQPGQFFMYWFLLFLTHNMAISLFRAIGALSRNIVVANALGSLALFMLLLVGGFVLVKEQIHPWWIWGFWADPLQFGTRALLINEFSAPRWQRILDIYSRNPNGSPRTLGESLLATYSFNTDYWWVWVAVGVMIGYNILFNIVIVVAHKFLGPFNMNTAVTTEEALTEREIAKRGHDGSGQDVKIDIKATSDRLSARRLALQGYSQGTMAPGSRKSLDTASRRSIDPASRRSLDPAPRRSLGGKNTELVSQRALPAIPSEGNFMAVGSNAVANGHTSAKEMVPASSSGYMDIEAGQEGAGAQAHGMVLPFMPLTMTFRDMHYWVPLPGEMQGKSAPNINKVHGKQMLELLRGITSAFRPGILTCLMGVSGAGKTTLMDVLAGRKTGGVVTGDIRINGYPKKQATFSRVSGYVEQTDVHSPQTTVKEALQFSARLRFSRDVPKETVEAFVEEVMDLVELDTLKNVLVGLPGVSGLSVEQRKRLTIAVELVANPSIVFMDEPTSGLDARAAAIVMRTVRNIVNTGRTIVCTIHQPSIDIFEAFDELLLLKRGGQTIYAGPTGHNSQELIDYYEAVPGVPRYQNGQNPATWMLEVTSAGAEARMGVDFAEIYAQSNLFKQQEAIIERESTPEEGVEDLHFDTVYARSKLEQYWIMLWKYQVIYWRLPEYNGVRFSFTLGIALLFGTVFWKLGGSTGTQQEITNTLGALYTATLFLGIMNSIFVQPVFGDERTVFYREKAAGMYSVIPWYMGIATIELVYIVLQSVLYVAVIYFMARFAYDAAKFFWFLFFMVLTLIYFNFYGIASVALTPNLLVAAVLSGAFYGLFNLFAGFVAPKPSIPGWWIWLYYLNPVSWTLNGLVSSNIGDYTDRLVQLSAPAKDGSLVQTVSVFLDQNFGFKHSWLGIDVAVLIGFGALFWLIGAIAMMKLNFQQR